MNINNTSNFKELIESNSYYLDKTYMIEELLDRKGYVTIFLRPSKYGKSLFISMLDMTMKDNKYLEFGIVTGILRPSEPGIFGGFNNYCLYSLKDDRFNNFFGFTKEEVRKVLNDFNLVLTKEVEDMYDNDNYNPWSIINYCKTKVLKPYIILSDFIIDNIKKCTDYSKEYIEKLLKGDEIYFRYDVFTSYKNIDRNILNILFFNKLETYSACF